METHVRVLGILNIIFGLASLAVVALILWQYGSFGNMYQDYDSLSLLLTVSAIYHGLLAIPLIVLGFYVLRYQEWARSAMIVVSALNILNVPFGSIVGGYTLGILFSSQVDPLFQIKGEIGRRDERRKVAAAAVAKQEKAASVLRSREADAGPQ